MARRDTTPLGAVALGVAAGVAGTAAMTGWQELAARLRDQGGESDSDSDAAPGSAGGSNGGPRDPWADASAPAKAARKIAAGVFDRDIPADRIALVANVMHWAYGTGWGAVYGLLAGSLRRRRPLRHGLAFGTFVWAMSYAQLVPMGLYEPPWRYPSAELALDLSYHLAYGAGTGAAYRLAAGS